MECHVSAGFGQLLTEENIQPAGREQKPSNVDNKATNWRRQVSKKQGELFLPTCAGHRTLKKDSFVSR